MGQMDIAPLSIPLVRQDPDSDDCLRACALMVFRYFKEPVTKEEVWKNLHVYKKHSGLRGGLLTDFGRLALKRKYNCEIRHYDWKWWNSEVKQSSSKGKHLISSLRKLRKVKDDWSLKKVVGKEIKFIKNGGVIKMTIPSFDYLDNLLTRRLPVILTVSANDFYQNPNLDKMHDNHAVVITGKEKNKYLIKDPLYAVNRLNKNDLQFAWFRAGGCSAAIYPKKEKKKTKSPKIKQTKLRF
jgi:ABC-type bacteriocin/lantibiotic exporter with double-glycine peptidase domain